MYEYYGKELTGFAITSAIVGASIGIATINVFYIRNFKPKTNKKITKKKKVNPTDYFPATDDLSNAEEDFDEVSYAAPREAAFHDERNFDETSTIPSVV